jgi:hypothetical protein
MHVDEAGGHHQPLGVDDFPAFRGDGPRGLQAGDFAVLDQHVPVFFQALGRVHNKAAGNEQAHGWFHN